MFGQSAQLIIPGNAVLGHFALRLCANERSFGYLYS